MKRLTLVICMMLCLMAGMAAMPFLLLAWLFGANSPWYRMNVFLNGVMGWDGTDD